MYTDAKYIGDLWEPGWKATTPHYIIQCDLHGEQVVYPQGYYYTLNCPDCMKDKPPTRQTPYTNLQKIKFVLICLKTNISHKLGFL